MLDEFNRWLQQAHRHPLTLGSARETLTHSTVTKSGQKYLLNVCSWPLDIYNVNSIIIYRYDGTTATKVTGIDAFKDQIDFALS